MRIGTGRRHDGRWRLLQALCAGYVLLAQLVLVLAPLADRGHPEPAAVAIASVGGIYAIHADRGHLAEHNPTTCPACIAQSIHAPAQMAPEPFLGLLEGPAIVASLDFLTPSSPSLALPRSRAPPVLT